MNGQLASRGLAVFVQEEARFARRLSVDHEPVVEAPAAVDEILGNGSYRERAAHIGAAITRAPGPLGIEAVLDSLAGARTS